MEASIAHWIGLICNVTDRILMQDDIDEALQVALEQLAALLGADRCVFVLHDVRKPPFISHEFRLSSSLPAIRGLRLDPILYERILQSPTPIVVRDFASIGSETGGFIKRGFIKSMLCGGLTYKGSTIGILSIHDCTTMRDWNAEEIGTVRWFCVAISIYISTIRMQAIMTSLGDQLMAGLKELSASSAQQGLSRTKYVKEIRTQTRAYDDGRIDHVFPTLTKRERQVLLRLERSNKEIASELYTSHHTVKGHVNRLFRKLGVDDRQSAIALVQHALARRT